jgi:hypothetical protein
MNCHRLTRRSLLGAATLSVGPLSALASQAPASDLTIVEPRVIDDILLNPGIGFETFHCFNGDKSVPNHPECSIAYYRFYWDQVEPEEDKFDIALVESLLAKARSRKQQLAVRFMAMDTVPKTPAWYQKKGAIVRYTVKRRSRLNPEAPPVEVETSAPDFNSPYFHERQQALLQAFGSRFNGHPDLLRMEIGSIGRWAEWHTAGTPVPMPSEENALRTIDYHFKYWDRTPLVMLINYVPGLRHAVSRGAGWRADSLGDYAHFSQTWSHMVNAYPEKLASAVAADAWRRGIVTFEPPGNMLDLERYVPSIGGGYDAMWDQALRWGASSFNGKSTPIPDSQLAPMQRFLRRCGYRFVLRSVAHSRTANPGEAFRVMLNLDNTGVAPPYRAYELALRLRRGAEPPLIQTLAANLHTCLPGKRSLDTRVDLPAATPAGDYQLAIAILDPHSRAPDVKLANAGIGPDGWYPVSTLTIR